MNPKDSTLPPDGLQKAVFFIFCGFLLIGLNLIIDPRAMDISLIPRLLALQVFLMFVVIVVTFTSLANRIDGSPLKDPLVVCFAGYVALTAFSLTTASNVTAGFTEVFKTFSVLIVLVLACVVLPWWRCWPEVVMKCVVVAGWLALVAGLHDWITGPGWGWHERGNMLAVMGLMSNVNLYASFLLLLLPYCVGGAFALQGVWRWAAGLVSLLLLPVMLALQTRAVYLGLVSAVAAGLLAFIAARPRHQCQLSRVIPRAAVAAGLVFVVLLLLAPGASPVAERVRSIYADRSMTAAGGRPVIWLASLGMIRDHPLTGVGAGNFPVRLHDYFDTDDPEFSTVHPNWLQPHNDFLWVFAEKGIVAWILFLAIWALALRHLTRLLRRGAPHGETWLAIAAASGLVGCGVVSFFDFPLERINHQVYFAFYLAIPVLLDRRGLSPRPCRAGLVRSIGVAVLCVLLAGTLYATAALRQERLMIFAREAFLNEDWPSTVSYAERAATRWKSLDPFASPVVFFEGLGHLMLANHHEALACFEQARTQMPSRSYIINGIALTHAMLGRHEEAISYYNEVLRRSPGHVNTIHSIAAMHLRANRPRKAIDLLNTISVEQQTEEINSTVERARGKLHQE